MTLYPAIDLYEGEVVRLRRGDFAEKTVYSRDPAAVARAWEEEGACWLHVVDLEGSKTGLLKNKPALLKIRKAVRTRIQFGGGIRSLEDVKALLGEGMDRVVLGTKALEEKFFEDALQKFGPKIAVSLDIQGGLLQTQGWLKPGAETLEAAIARLNPFPLETLIYTDIQRDGMLEGPDFAGLEKILGLTGARVILSGGVAALEDIQKCTRWTPPHFEGAIIGRALYEKKFTLREALRVAGS